MRKLPSLLVWGYLNAAAVLEAYIAITLSHTTLFLRDLAIGVVALSTVAAIATYYMGLYREHAWIRAIAVIGTWFGVNLTLIWTASLVH